MAMQTSYAQEALETYAILYANGNPGMLRPDYPPPIWESMVRHAHLTPKPEVRFVLDGTPEADRLAAERAEILERNKEREDIVEVVEEPDKDSRISALEAQLALLTKAIMSQSGAPASVGADPQALAADTPQGYTRDMLLSMDINDLRPLAVSYETSGAGTRESLADRILEQIAKGVKPK